MSRGLRGGSLSPRPSSSFHPREAASLRKSPLPPAPCSRPITLGEAGPRLVSTDPGEIGSPRWTTARSFVRSVAPPDEAGRDPAVNPLRAVSNLACREPHGDRHPVPVATEPVPCGGEPTRPPRCREGGLPWDRGD